MIRSPIFLVLLPLFVTTSTLRADDGAINSCELGAWSIDTDPAGTNVRAGPGTNHGIIGRLPPQLKTEGYAFGAEISITGSADGWLRIDKGVMEDYVAGTTTVAFDGEGWVSARLFTFSVEGNFLRSAPSSDAAPVVDLYSGGGSDFFATERILSCQGRWAEVEGSFQNQRYRGWTDDTCSNQVTTCP